MLRQILTQPLDEHMSSEQVAEATGTRGAGMHRQNLTQRLDEHMSSEHIAKPLGHEEQAVPFVNKVWLPIFPP